MTAAYARHVSTRPAGLSQVRNDAGGYVFAVPWQTRLQRFLILGHEGGTYYTTPVALTHETVACIDEGLKENFITVVDTIVEVSNSGRAPKNDPAIFALAYIAGHHKETTAAAYALSQLNKVCRIGTHLFDFCTYVQEFRGWGRGLRDAISRWYTGRSPLALAKQVTKYQQRNGWSHRDLLRKAHPTCGGLKNEVLEYVTQREQWWNHRGVDPDSETTQYLIAVEEAKTASKSRLIQLIADYGLVREHIPTAMLNDIDIWDALLENMPLTAMIRNLGKMSSIGLLKPLARRNNHVLASLLDAEALKQQRVHPLTLLIALRQYEQGCGDRGKLKWTPVPQISAALEDSFYLSFGTLEPTGKRFLLGVDVSGSMTWKKCAGATSLTCCEGAAVMAMVAARTEPNYHIIGFESRPVELTITAKDTLSEACRKAQAVNFGGTDCAAAMAWAYRNKVDVDVFCIYTDSQTWSGYIHPCQSLNEYRNLCGLNSKLAAFQMAGNPFSVADPNDPGMLDFCGFDTAAPVVLHNFACGGL